MVNENKKRSPAVTPGFSLQAKIFAKSETFTS